MDEECAVDLNTLNLFSIHTHLLVELRRTCEDDNNNNAAKDSNEADDHTHNTTDEIENFYTTHLLLVDFVATEETCGSK